MGNKDIEYSPKGESPSKTVEVETSRESKEASKGKCLYIKVIIGKAPRANLPSNGTMKKMNSENDSRPPKIRKYFGKSI